MPRRRRGYIEQPATVWFDWTKWHPYWRPGVGFGLMLDRAVDRPTSLPAIRVRISEFGEQHGDLEAERLSNELDVLLVIKSTFERAASEVR